MDKTTTVQEESSENEYLTYALKNGILFQRFKDHVEKVTYPIALVTAQDRQQLTRKTLTPLFIDVNQARVMEVKAMKYYVQPESMSDVAASAIWVHRYPQYVLVNFFLSFSRKFIPFPVKVFMVREEALLWLQQYVS